MGSAYAVAAAVGVGVAFQVAILGRSSGKFHPLAISVALQLAGLLVGTLWMVTQRAWPDVKTVVTLWWWVPLGALGWLLVAALGFASHRIGVATTLGLAVASQLLVGLGVDVRSGVADLGVRPIAGAALLVAVLILITGRA
jgi:transporter family-2 protein